MKIPPNKQARGKNMKKLIVQNRRGTKEDLEKSKVVPYDGEIVVEQQSKYSKLKAGDGVTPYDELPYVTDETDTKLAGVTGRVSALEAGVGEPVHGSWESEVKDIRQGWDGMTYPSAGDAVRAIAESSDNLRKSLEQFIDADAVDGLLYENNMLQLTASGQPVGEPVEIKGGSGGGGTSSVKLRLTNLTPEGTNFSATTQDTVIISFLFTSTEDDIPTGDFTCDVDVGGVVRKSLSLSQSDTGASVDVTSYLKSDQNKIKITCTDVYGNSRMLIYNINIIELLLKSSFDANKVYKNTAYPNGIDFRYTAIGLVDKTVYFKLDGKQVESKYLGSSTSGKEIAQVFPISLFTHGSHSLTVEAQSTLDGKTITSNTLSYDLLIHIDGETAPMIGSSIDFDETTEGELLTIPYIVYDPSSAVCNVTLQIKNSQGHIYSQTAVTVDQTLQTWSVRKYPVGKNIQFTIYYKPERLSTAITKTHYITVNKAIIDVQPEEGALLDLSALGRSNSESDPAKWESNGYTTTFENFNWKSNGWITDENGDTCLRLSGGAKATINMEPLSKTNFDINNSGLTIELEFAVRDVNNRDTVVMSCYDGIRGFELTADKAFIKSVDKEVSCNYKDEDKVKLAFTIDKQGALASGFDSPQFLCVYLDGIMSSVERYSNNSDFTNNNKIVIGDIGCTFDLYRVRIYNKALTPKELTNNYIADTLDINKKIELYDDNNIYSGSGLLSYEAVKSKIPVITFTGTMPKFKGDKRIVWMDFENPFDASKNFKNVYGGPIQVNIDVQGTSSQWYVRKNWKVKLKDKKHGIDNKAYQHMDNQLPAKTFCIKVDYAEATGTHNTQSANLIETLYTEKVPAQLDDPRVRSTVVGFPCVIFEKTTEDSDPVFSSKANFNIDKGAEDSFGFNENYSVESWEFRNNTEDACNFLDTWDNSKFFLNTFEPRYITESESSNYSIDDLEDYEDKYLASIQEGGTPLTPAEQQTLLEIRLATSHQFKELHDWVVSTNRAGATNVQLETPYVAGKDTYTHDTADYRLAKFKNEFEDHFDMQFSLIYYIYTFFALMTDQRSKNMFLTRWTTTDINGKKTTKWYPYFYDNDTCWGINNEGYLTFDYYHEDTDQVNGVNVFNGQTNALWINFRLAFQREISEMYGQLRQGRLTYDKVINQFITQGSDAWSASIYNEDIEYKYTSMARPENAVDGKIDVSNLYQVRGNGADHLKYLVQNRFKYCDSKWNTGDYPQNYISMRVNTPSFDQSKYDEASDEDKLKMLALKKSIEVVPPSPVITVTPYSNMYCGVKYKANGTIEQKRSTKNQPVTFGESVTEVFNDTEAAIFGASELSSIGDLSALYLRTLVTTSAVKLTELIVGNHTEGYNNTMLNEIQLGSNELLRKIDVTNCSVLTNPLQLGKCENIEEVYAAGTAITGVELPSSGYVKLLHVPNTIKTLVITNHPNLTDKNLVIGSGRDVQNVVRLNIANCKGLNTTALLDECLKTSTNLERVRVTDINWTDKTAAELQKLYKSKADGGYGLRGIDANGADTDTINISGTCTLNENISGELMAELVRNLPYINFKMGDGYKVTSIITFMNNDGSAVLWTETLSTTSTSNITCPDPVVEKHITAPTRASTAQYDYKWSGWSIQSAIDRVPQEDALKNIVGNRTVYPAFDAILRSYTVSFYTGTTLLYSIIANYGSVVSFDASKVTDSSLLDNGIPKNVTSEKPEAYEFTGWFPTTDNPIVGVTKYTAQFYLNESSYFVPTLSDIDYTTADTKLTITKYKNSLEPLVDIPASYDIVDQGTFTTDTITGYDSTNENVTGFSGTNVEYVKIPNSVTTIGRKAFYSMPKLSGVVIGNGVTKVDDFAFNNNKSLKDVTYNATNASRVGNTYETGVYPFDNNATENGFNLTIGPDVESIGQYMFHQSSTNSALHTINKLDLSQATKLTRLNSAAFSNTNINELVWSPSIKFIGSSAFVYNTTIEELVFPEGIGELDNSSFMQWHALKRVTIPSTLVIHDGAFRYDESLEQFICSEDSRYRFENGCLIDAVDDNGYALVVGTAKANIPDKVKTLRAYCFAGCTGLTSITIPKGVVSTPTDTFAGCSNLTNVVFNEGFLELAQSTFYQCEKLTNITLPSTLQRIQLLAFALTPLETITLPASVNYLGLSVFQNCRKLKSVYILNPDGVQIQTTREGKRPLFDGCDELTDIYVAWSEGAVEGADYFWNAPNSNVTIHYDYKETR